MWSGMELPFQQSRSYWMQGFRGAAFFLKEQQIPLKEESAFFSQGRASCEAGKGIIWQVKKCLCCTHLYHLQGPREDSGYSSDINPGIQLVERIFNYCSKLHPKTKVMVSGIRRKQGKSCPLICLYWATLLIWLYAFESDAFHCLNCQLGASHSSSFPLGTAGRQQDKYL